MVLNEKQKEILKFIFEHCADDDLQCIMMCEEEWLIMVGEDSFYYKNGVVSWSIMSSLGAFSIHFDGMQGKLKVYAKDFLEKEL